MQTWNRIEALLEDGASLVGDDGVYVQAWKYRTGKPTRVATVQEAREWARKEAEADGRIRVINQENGITVIRFGDRVGAETAVAAFRTDAHPPVQCEHETISIKVIYNPGKKQYVIQDVVRGAYGFQLIHAGYFCCLWIDLPTMAEQVRKGERFCCDWRPARREALARYIEDLVAGRPGPGVWSKPAV